MWCYSLETIKLSNNITHLSNNLFNTCTALKNIVLPINLKIIGDQVFDDCISLESITIPENVKFIGERAFNYCESLKNIVFKSKIAPKIKSNTFENINDDCYIHIYPDAKGYNTKYWKKFNIKYLKQEITTGNLSICYNIGALSFPDDNTGKLSLKEEIK